MRRASQRRFCAVHRQVAPANLSVRFDDGTEFRASGDTPEAAAELLMQIIAMHKRAWPAINSTRAAIIRAGVVPWVQ